MGNLRSLAFLTRGNYPDDDPFSGLDATLELFAYGERLGFDGAWIRQRHLEHGVGSAAVFLAAAAQRTSRIELGTAVIPIGYESPFRLAEDLSPADVLLRGRLQIGSARAGGGSSRSVRWAGEHGLGLLTGNIVSGEHSDDFIAAQTRLIEEFSAFEAAGPVAVGRVVVPWDSAGRRTRKRYQEYAAGRHDRTLRPHGERRTLFAPDLVGPAAEIAERLRADPVVAGASALRLELPYEFDREDYEQILTDTATLVAPGLGWTPTTR